jgi:GT2 family glycosyltransferase
VAEILQAGRSLTMSLPRASKLVRSSLASVVIPTYRRPGPLLECIHSVAGGSARPREIIVVGRDHDTPTREVFVLAQSVCAGKITLRAGWVTEPGHLPPVQKGLELGKSDIVAFLDDDVTVTPEWLGHLTAPFADPSVGAVGGRVITPSSQPARLKGRPGCISWYGKHWGNVASVEGVSPLDVHGVMEGNCAWRRELLASLKFDPVLNFDDASMYGLDLCLQAKRKGYRVLYEPRAVVHHHAVPRAPGLDRADRPRRDFSYTRNYTYIMLKHLPWWRRPIFLAWWFLIGERGSWGLGAALVDFFKGRIPPPSHLWRTFNGKVEGILLSGSSAHAHGS